MVGQELLDHDDVLALTPAIYQECIPGERHLRISVVGDRCDGALIEARDLDWRYDLNVPFRPYPLDGRLEQGLRATLRELGLVMGIFDVKLTDGALPMHDRLERGGVEWLNEDGSRVAPEDLPARRAARRGETVRGVVLRMRTRTSERWLALSAAPITLRGAGAVVSFTDITDRKRADEASAREHELLLRLFEQLPVMIATYDPKLGGFRFNAEFKRVLGWNEADAAAGDLMALAYPDPDVRAAAAEHMRSLAVGWREFPVTAKDGSVVPSSWANLRLSDDTLVGIGIDLRERKQAEEALRRSEGRLRRMIDANPIGVVNRDLDGRVLYANEAYLRIVRATRAELEAGRVRWDELTAPEHRAADAAAMAEAERVGVSPVFEKEYLLRDGTRVPVLVAFAAMGTAGELTAFDGTYTIEASLDGYTFTPATRTVTVSGGNVADQDFTSQQGISIAGEVTGEGREGVTLTLTGPAPATTTRTVTSEADGDFQFVNVASGSYLVTPSRAGGWTFSPANILVTVSGTSVTGASFASTPATRTLSGRLTGAIVAGVFVTVSGDADATVVTDATGNFAFTGLSPGSYVVTPSFPGFAFAPASRSATIEAADVTGQDFVSAATHRIAGRISGDVLAGVAVSLSGPATASATTDASGYFEFPGLGNGAYVVTASRSGFAFTPATRSVTLAGADVTNANFTASAAPSPAFAVAGAIAGASPSRVTVTLQGATTTLTRSDAAGAFRFDGVPPGTYLVIPSSEDHTFDPASRLVVVSAADVAGQAFTAAVSPSTRTIAGNVAGAGTAGVAVRLVGPSPATTSRTVTTDAAGDFAFRGLTDGLYLATPSLAGFAFGPANCLVTVAGPSVSNIQFTSAQAPHSISGRISGAVTAGVPVTLAAGGDTLTVLTAADGTFTFTGLANGAYTVAPALAGFYFSPVGASVRVDGANVTGVTFVSTPSHRISGFVIGDVLEGVEVRLTGAAVGTATTDASGFFELTDLRDGGYVLTASLEGYTFDPQLLSVDLAGADVATAGFTATLVPTYTVSGTISGALVSGVTVGLSGAATAETTTDGSGAYVFTGLANGSYMVIPSADGFTFTPASRGFRIDDADVGGQDFSSAVTP